MTLKPETLLIGDGPREGVRRQGEGDVPTQSAGPDVHRFTGTTLFDTG